MASLNKMMLIGNVGNDPEMRFTPNGNPTTSFNIAVGRNYTTKNGERRQETEWFTVVTWNRLAETCNQFVSKGQRAYVEGRLRSRSWEGKDGQTRFRNEITADRVIFLGRPAAAPVEGSVAEEAGDVEADELPFEPEVRP